MKIDLFVTGFGRPDLLREQHRLLTKHLRDRFNLAVLDNTREPVARANMQSTCHDLRIFYQQVNGPKGEHHEALAFAHELAEASKSAYWGCLDHDIFCSAPCTLIDKIDQAGFLGLGQTYAPRFGPSSRYLWPGWIFFKRDWLDGRTPNFDGVRARFKFDDGDCGSMLHPLFTDEDWERLYQPTHGYEMIREEDGDGLQSWGYEIIDRTWIHLTNAAHWKSVPDSDGRDHLLREMLAAL